uniref:Uncharacterized protein n=1 Tax=Tetranychus urticae TaxID=32264 RepID=T1L256_TETUR
MHEMVILVQPGNIFKHWVHIGSLIW